MRPLLLSILSILLLAACVTGPSRVESSNPTITYRFADDEEDEVEEQAEEYCDDFDRDAVLQDVDSDGDINVAVYECVG
ncbi:MAG TPA: hypothetical protein VFO41_10105 [Alphaproteobacteria bacterium]|nr:hypothetical protein [Alphaproteobacteria bacterium]